MILPDVNVLISAFRTDHPHHNLCIRWLEHILQAPSPFGVSRLVLSSVVRITTNSRPFRVPSTVDEAFGFCNFLINQPNCRLVEPGEGHWSIFQRLCFETNTRGSHVSDVWFAALAIEYGCEWISMDRDFSRFPGLKWTPPSVQFDD